MWPWIEQFAQEVGNSSAGLEAVPAREDAANKICSILEDARRIKTPAAEQDDEIYRLLDACRVFMRDRRGIDQLLSAEVLGSLLSLSEAQSWSFRVREETLKCIINSVYSRPEFVSDTFISKGIVRRLFELAKRGGTVSMHWLVWRICLVSCEAPEIPKYLSGSLEAWQLIYATLFYSFKYGCSSSIIVGDRANLLLDLIKLVTVLANEMQWTAEQEKLLPEVFSTVHRLGGLLLEILCFTHSQVSPLNDNLVEFKNKTMEVFVFLPGYLLAAFICQQQKETSGSSEEENGELNLSPVIDHLHTMLLAVRVEKSRPLKEMLPALIVCHNLAKTGDSQILAGFKDAILSPPSQPAGTGFSDGEVEASKADQVKAFYFKHLKFFLTCLDTEVRRYAAEWLFLLCNENANEYTRHTGVGNAIGLLRMKGLA